MTSTTAIEPGVVGGGVVATTTTTTAATTTSATTTTTTTADTNNSNRRKKHNTLESSGFRSFVAGLSAGMASTVAGYVPDTIKVRLQTQPLSEPVRYKGAIDCAVRMVREEGVGSLFRGMSTPLMSRAVVNGLCFSTYTLTMQLMHPDGGAHLGTVFFAGGCAGAVSALIASPTELIKVQMQLGIVAGGPIAHIRHLLRHAGWRGLIMLGMLPTILRDFVCMGTFFTTTSEFSHLFSMAYPNSSVGNVAALLGGAMAGVAGWALCYPFDVWKSNVQQYFDTNQKGKRTAPLSFYAFFRERYLARGVRGFYSGLAPTLFRAIPVNATKFFAFDLAIRAFQMATHRT